MKLEHKTSEVDPKVDYDRTIVDQQSMNFDEFKELGQTIKVSEQGMKTVKASEYELDNVDAKVDLCHLGETFGPSVFAQLNTSDLFAKPRRFFFKSVLGSGTYGDVYSVKDQDLNRQVALKQFKGDTQQALHACRNELRFVGKLEHPGIPPVYQAALNSEGKPFIVMKELEGESLLEVIDRLKDGDLETHQRYTFRYRIELMIQLLRIVAQAHQSNILHRDIKSENIYLGKRGELYLIDWGIAEDLETAWAEPILCGTPLYMSPEQAQAKPIDVRSDIYSVGAVAYELLSLHSSAPKTENLQELITLLPSYKPDWVGLQFHEAQGYIPSEFQSIIMKALSRDPELRFTSAYEMMIAFEQALNGEFEVVCVRTFLKRNLIRLNQWIDLRKHNIVLSYFILFMLPILFVLIGIFIGVRF